MRQRKPIRVFWSPLSRRFYASQQYKDRGNGNIEVTGEKYDVTDEIARIITHYEIEFTPIKPKVAS